jgi:ZIP family zinc transporter
VLIDYPWQTGQPYLVGLLTSTGLVIEHEIPAAVATPRFDAGFLGVMALLGAYVGVIPVLLGWSCSRSCAGPAGRLCVLSSR